MEASAQRAETPAAQPGKASSRTKSERKLAWMLCAPAVIVMLAVTAYPILYAFVLNFSATYLPTTGPDCCTQYSPIFTFILIALVLAFRPRGLFGRDG